MVYSSTVPTFDACDAAMDGLYGPNDMCSNAPSRMFLGDPSGIFELDNDCINRLQQFATACEPGTGFDMSLFVYTLVKCLSLLLDFLLVTPLQNIVNKLQYTD